MILEMRSIYTKYLDQTNKANKERNEKHTCALGLEQELHISNKKREHAIFLLQQQTVKYEKMIYILQSSAFAKPDQPLPFIKRFFD